MNNHKIQKFFVNDLNLRTSYKRNNEFGPWSYKIEHPLQESVKDSFNFRVNDKSQILIIEDHSKTKLQSQKQRKQQQQQIVKENVRNFFSNQKKFQTNLKKIQIIPQSTGILKTEQQCQTKEDFFDFSELTKDDISIQQNLSFKIVDKNRKQFSNPDSVDNLIKKLQNYCTNEKEIFNDIDYLTLNDYGQNSFRAKKYILARDKQNTNKSHNYLSNRSPLVSSLIPKIRINKNIIFQSRSKSTHNRQNLLKNCFISNRLKSLEQYVFEKSVF